MTDTMTFGQRLVARYAPVHADTQAERYLPFAYPDFFHLPPSVQQARVKMMRMQEEMGKVERGEWSWYRWT